MTYSNLKFLDQRKSFSAISFSLLIHLSLLTLLYLVKEWSSGDDGKLTLVKSAVRVDVVGMPKYTLKELQQMQQQVVEASKSKEEPQIVQKENNAVKYLKEDLEKKKQSEKSLDDMLKNFSQKKIVEKKVNKKNNDSQVKNNPALDKLVMMGNKISKGEALFASGEGEEISGAFADYIFKIPDLVKKNWKLPTYLLSQDLQCRVRIYIGKNGDILNTKIVKSSGVEDFDRRAVRAITQSAPFPAPSTEISKRLEKGEVVLGFPL